MASDQLKGALDTLLAVAKRHREVSEDARIRKCVEIITADLSAAEAAAAREAVERCAQWHETTASANEMNNILGSAVKHSRCARIIRALAPPPPGALDRVRQAARAEGMEDAASLIMPKNDKSDWTEYAHIRAEAAAAIRAAKDQPA